MIYVERSRQGYSVFGVRLEVTEAVLNHLSGSRAGVVGIYQRHDWGRGEAVRTRRTRTICGRKGLAYATAPGAIHVVRGDAGAARAHLGFRLLLA